MLLAAVQASCIVKSRGAKSASVPITNIGAKGPLFSSRETQNIFSQEPETVDKPRKGSALW
jgi:hypothetical protein